MTNFGKKLLAGTAGAAMLFAPVAAMADTAVITDTAPAGTYYDPATGTVTTTTVTTTTIIGQRVDLADPIAWLEEKGYSNVEQVPGVTKDHELAFHAADGMGQPVEIILDEETGEVVREKNLRKVDIPSKNP